MEGRISRLINPWNPAIAAKLERIGMPLESVLCKHDVDLLSTVDITQSEIDELKRRIALSISPIATTALKLHEMASNRVKTGICDALDNLLHGGLPSSSITEICATPGAGSSQLCLQVLLNCCVDVNVDCSDTAEQPEPAHVVREEEKVGGGALFFDIGSSFNIKRLVELAQNRFPEMYKTGVNSNSEKNLELLVSRILIHKIESTESLLMQLKHPKLEETIVDQNIKIFVIDSLAYLVRHEFGSTQNEISARQSIIGQIAGVLKRLSESFGIVALVANATSRDCEPEKGRLYSCGDSLTGNGSGESSSSEAILSLTGALGPAWSHCITTRLILVLGEGDGEGVMEDEDDQDLSLSQPPNSTDIDTDTRARVQTKSGVVWIEKSPMVPVTGFRYRIDRHGVGVGM